jgi:hypothetical protein
MPRPTRQFSIIAISLLLGTAACASARPSPTAQPEGLPSASYSSAATDTPLVPSPIPLPASPTEAWKTYSNPEYGFSVNYPAQLEILHNETSASLYIGEQIHLLVGDGNPLDCEAGCPFYGALVESSGPTTVAGLTATQVAGYFGSEGGDIPQRFLAYVIERDGHYYTFTLYALGLRTTNHDLYSIWPLNEEDVVLFEELLGTLKFAQ